MGVETLERSEMSNPETTSVLNLKKEVCHCPLTLRLQEIRITVKLRSKNVLSSAAMPMHACTRPIITRRRRIILHYSGLWPTF
jgi:hypothetical protein